ncbi:unnamed protein product, partial [Prorocentrum cordatum]
PLWFKLSWRGVFNPGDLLSARCPPPAFGDMARSASLLIACAVAAITALSVGSVVLSFVGTSPPASAGLRTRQRSPAVEMHFFNFEPVTTTPPPPPAGAFGLDAANSGTYIVVMTILFFGSVLANGNGFFGPWRAKGTSERTDGAASGLGWLLDGATFSRAACARFRAPFLQPARLGCFRCDCS